jgi:predicted RNase H-like HicB family nuclease
MKKSHGHFNVILRPEPEGGFTAIVPALPGCVTYGRTLGEAKKMAKDAIGGYIESLKKHKEPVPADDETLVARCSSVWLCHGSS